MKDSKKNGYNIYELGFFGVSLVILILIVFSLFDNKKVDAYTNENDNMSLEEHCAVAICNNDSTMCYNYDLEGEESNITWQGDCSKLNK